MLFSGIILLLILTIAYYQATMGLFSAMIMMVLTICCGAAAFGSYEWVAANWLAPYWNPSFAHPIALAALFGLPLLILRLVLDRVIKRECLLPAWLGRIGGGVCGLVTAMIMVGVMSASLQMIPFGESVIGFSRFDVANPFDRAPDNKPPDPEAEERSAWLNPEGVAVKVTEMLSTGILSTEYKLHEAYPNLMQAAGWVNTVDREVSRFAPPRSIRVGETRPVRVVYEVTPGDERKNEPTEYEAVPPAAGHAYQMVRVQLLDPARDERKSHVFTLRQFRLVGRRGADGPYEQYFPVATKQPDESDPTNRYMRYRTDTRGKWPVIDNIISPRGGGAEIELVFEVPAEFVPSFLEYKRGARATLSFEEDSSRRRTEAPPEPPPPAPRSAPEEPETAQADRRGERGGERSTRRRPRPGETSEETADSQRGGRARRFASLSGKSFFGEEMPAELTVYQSVRNVDTRGSTLRSGHVVAYVDEQEGATGSPLTSFEVPRDKRLLHLNVQGLGARSGLGRALSQAIAVAQNYLVTDASGRQYKAIGNYALANVNGRSTLEIQYFPEQAGTVGGMGAFNRIKEDQLGRDDQMVFLFLVEPGAQIVSFSTGGPGSREDDLRGENLVAPR